MRIGFLCAAAACAFGRARLGPGPGADDPLGPPEQHRPSRQLGVQKFAEVLSAKSGGKLKVREFPASQLGNEMQQQSALQGGVAGDVGAVDHLAGRHRQGVRPARLPVPRQQLRAGRRAGRRAARQGAARQAAGEGPGRLGYFDLGFRNVTNSKRPITKREDLDGLKMRVIPNPVFLETFKTFKANPVPMPFAELYGALESKAVDGQENPFCGDPVEQVLRSAEVRQRRTNHVYAPTSSWSARGSGTSCRRPSRRCSATPLPRRASISATRRWLPSKKDTGRVGTSMCTARLNSAGNSRTARSRASTGLRAPIEAANPSCQSPMDAPVNGPPDARARRPAATAHPAARGDQPRQASSTARLACRRNPSVRSPACAVHDRPLRETAPDLPAPTARGAMRVVPSSRDRPLGCESDDPQGVLNLRPRLGGSLPKNRWTAPRAWSPARTHWPPATPRPRPSSGSARMAGNNST